MALWKRCTPIRDLFRSQRSIRTLLQYSALLPSRCEGGAVGEPTPHAASMLLGTASCADRWAHSRSCRALWEGADSSGKNPMSRRRRLAPARLRAFGSGLRPCRSIVLRGSRTIGAADRARTSVRTTFDETAFRTSATRRGAEAFKATMSTGGREQRQVLARPILPGGHTTRAEGRVPDRSMVHMQASWPPFAGDKFKDARVTSRAQFVFEFSREEHQLFYGPPLTGASGAIRGTDLARDGIARRQGAREILETVRDRCRPRCHDRYTNPVGGSPEAVPRQSAQRRCGFSRMRLRRVRARK